MDELREMVLDAYDRIIVLQLADVAVDCCITKAPCGGEKAGKSPVDRSKGGVKRHDSSLLGDTLDALKGTLDSRPELARVHLDGGYDSEPPERTARGS